MRYLYARNDREKIAAWSSDLIRVLHVFNVRYTASVWPLLTLRFQTELAVNTRAAVSEIHDDVVNTNTIVSELKHNLANTQIMVSDIHRTVVKGQEGGDSNNLLVNGTPTASTTE